MHEQLGSAANSSEDHNRGKSSGIFFALSGIIIMLATTTSEEVVPGYSVKYQAISALGGAGYPTMVYWNILFLISGILWVAGTRILFRKSRFFLSSIDFYLAGIGLILVSLNPWNIDPFLHLIGALMVFIFGAIAAIISPKFTGGLLRVPSIMLGILSLTAFIGDGAISAVLGPGGTERLVYYPIFLWVILFGGTLVGTTNTENSHSSKSEKI